LLELLIVLAIASLLVAVVPPVVSKVIPGVRLEGAARDLAVDLREARNRAVTFNSVIAVTFSFNPAMYRIDGESERRTPEGTRLAVRGPDTGGTSAYPSPGASGDKDSYTLRFFPDGSSTGARIRVTGSNAAYSIDVGWLMGRVVLTEAPADV
jgi:general secretion pathway protein H